MRFWDTSALVPLVTRESATPTVQGLLGHDRSVVAWWATRVEITSALARALRRGTITQADLVKTLHRVRRLLASATIVEPTTTLQDRADRLLLAHELRAADAFQLAAALIIVQDRPQGFGFVTLDRRLCDAAGREGFTVYP